MATQTESETRAAGEVSFGEEGERLGCVFARVPGLCMDDVHRGSLLVGDRRAEVRLEPHQWIRVRLAVDSAPPPDDALRINHWLPGNVRYARTPAGMALVADTQTDGVAHLALSLEEIRLGMADALGTDCPSLVARREAKTRSLSAEEGFRELEAALARLPFGEDGLVRRQSADGRDQWELRPRIRGDPVPVLLDRLRGGARLHRTLLAKVPAKHRPVIADQALRWNARYRFCRLAWCDEELIVEAMLHEALVATKWLSSAALALAVVGREVRDVVETLAEDSAAACWYWNVLCDPRPGAVPGEAAFPT